eukprot:scaffold17244_cov72-Skeletonema_dohrnii-CCMP3373.AAC.1
MMITGRTISVMKNLNKRQARSPICCGGVQSFQRTHDQTPLPRGKGATRLIICRQGQLVKAFSPTPHFSLTHSVLGVRSEGNRHGGVDIYNSQEKSEAQVLEGKSACSCLLVDE